MKKGIIKWSNIILLSIIIWGLLHTNPHSALRARLFLEGYPKLAFTTEIKEMKSDLATKRIKFYMFYPQPKDRETGNSKLAYKVTRTSIFYTVTYHGGG